MWTILKFEKKQFFSLNNEIKNKLGNNFLIYRPKILINLLNKNKKPKKKVIDLMGDYLFCFHKTFNQIAVLESLKFCRGVKYFINGHIETQNDIKNFIEKCKKNENNKGYISNDFFELLENSHYKFVSGPFTSKIFKILEINKLKLKIALGNVKTTIDKNKFSINLV
jgi:hypothetical protein